MAGLRRACSFAICYLPYRSALAERLTLPSAIGYWLSAIRAANYGPGVAVGLVSGRGVAVGAGVALGVGVEAGVALGLGEADGEAFGRR
jgi:hypothetical protein